MYSAANKLLEDSLYLEALVAYKQAFYIDSTHAELNYKMGLCYYHAQNNKEANHYFENAADFGCTQV
ncbi:MAG: hypothetical protein HC896_18440 [Bacteroidales bacterium]|nr:hypothetical protein [Bacteroidales bacterium]